MTFLKEQQLEAEIAVFWDEFARHLPKSIEREALGDEKICNAFRAVYPKITTPIRTSWLRSEIEKLEGEIWTVQATDDAHRFYQVKDHNQALTSIITRYKEELKVLESK